MLDLKKTTPVVTTPSRMALTRRAAMASGAAIALPFTADAAHADELSALPDTADAIVRAAMAATGQPGAAMAVVRDGQVMLARGWGVQKLGASAPVDETTRFAIGSVSKAFTAAALAQLVDEGRIRWDDPVQRHLPNFALADPSVSAAITVRDLLLHVSGLSLGAGDLMVWPYTLHTRTEIVNGLRYLPLKQGFRAGYAYDNVLYVAAGELVAAVRGAPLEVVFQEHLLRPAGMTDTIALPSAAATAGMAWPHARLGGATRTEGALGPLARAVQVGDNTLASGGLSVSARDLGRWMQIQLAGGAVPGGGRLWSKAQGAEMWRPGVVIRVQDGPTAERPDRPNFDTYALGWQVSDYRGRRIVWHGGVVQGGLCMIYLVPSLNAGVAVLANAEEQVFVRSATHTLLDRLLEAPAFDWLATLKQRSPRPPMVSPPQITKVDAPAMPPLDLLVGLYKDAWYGEVRITRDGDDLTIDFTRTPGMSGPLEPWAPSVFRTRFGDDNIEDAFITFDAQATPMAAKARAVSTTADFSYDYQDLDLRKVGSL